jgi:hypothetical protein
MYLFRKKSKCDQHMQLAGWLPSDIPPACRILYILYVNTIINTYILYLDNYIFIHAVYEYFLSKTFS